MIERFVLVENDEDIFDPLAEQSCHFGMVELGTFGRVDEIPVYDPIF
ncbi:hypothetical protein [Sphingomonas sp. UYP23]